MTKRLNRRANVDGSAKQAASSEEEEDKVDWKQWEKLLGEEGEESERNLPCLPHASQNHR